MSKRRNKSKSNGGLVLLLLALVVVVAGLSMNATGYFDDVKWPWDKQDDIVVPVVPVKGNVLKYDFTQEGSLGVISESKLNEYVVQGSTPTYTSVTSNSVPGLENNENNGNGKTYRIFNNSADCFVTLEFASFTYTHVEVILGYQWTPLSGYIHAVLSNYKINSDPSFINLVDVQLNPTTPAVVTANREYSVSSNQFTIFTEMQKSLCIYSIEFYSMI